MKITRRDGKPRYLSIRLSDGELEALRALAEAHGRSLQKEAEHVLNQAIDEEKRKRKNDHA